MKVGSSLLRSRFSIFLSFPFRILLTSICVSFFSHTLQFSFDIPDDRFERRYFFIFLFSL